MLLLVIEASTERGVLGLFHRQQLISRVQLPSGLTHSQHLMFSIEQMFLNASLNPQDITFICLGNGPGSYTGMRVAAAVAQGISFALDIPIAPVSTLCGFIPQEDGCFMAVLDARTGGFFVAIGHVLGNQVSIEDPQLLTKEAFRLQLPRVKRIVTTYKESIVKRFSQDSEVFSIEILEQAPSVERMAYFAQKKYEQGNCIRGEEILTMNYLRKTQAEEEYEVRSQK